MVCFVSRCGCLIDTLSVPAAPSSGSPSVQPPQVPSSRQRFVALQHRDFRLIWIGQFVSIIGTQMQLVAINWNIFQLLNGTTVSIDLFGHQLTLNPEALGLGGVGLARIIP